MRHIMLFDLYSDGHHAVYIQQLCYYWVEQQCTGILSVVVPSSYTLQHSKLLTFIRMNQSARLLLHIIPCKSSLKSEKSIINYMLNDMFHGKFARQYIKKLKPTHVLFMYMDHIQLSLGMGLQFNFNVSLGGILFRPSLHYPYIGNPEVSWKEHLWRVRKIILLWFALRNRHMRYLFSLDPFAIPCLRKLSNKIRLVPLPDGFTNTQTVKSSSKIKAELGIDLQRRIALFFGIISERKGIQIVLESLNRLPKNSQEKICLLIVGRAPYKELASIKNKLSVIKKNSVVQIVWINDFVEENLIQDYFRCSDIVLITYQRHIGSSHVLIRAAAEGVPVLGSDYGLVGKNIMTYKLGKSTDTTKIDALSIAINDWIERGTVINFNKESARAFAYMNSAKKYAQTIFTTLV